MKEESRKQKSPKAFVDLNIYPRLLQKMFAVIRKVLIHGCIASQITDKSLDAGLEIEQPIRYISYIINYCLVLVTESNLGIDRCVCTIYVLEFDSKAFFVIHFYFLLFSGSQGGNYFKEVTNAISNYTHPKSRFVFTSSGGVFTGRNYTPHNYLYL